MRSKLLLVFAVPLAIMLFPSGCGTIANCPTCGTTVNGAYGIIDIIPVPGHNPTGAPGGPFSSFDISEMDSVHHRFYVSDRVELDVAVVDTQNNVAVNLLGGQNAVAGAGITPSVCATDGESFIPPIVTGLGNFTRFGCKTLGFGLQGGFGPNGNFGGFPGAQCCASRGNGVNPLSGPDGLVLSVDTNNVKDGNVLFVGNGSSSVAAFDLRPTFTTATAVPTVVAAFATGVSPDYDGPNGVAPCDVSSQGRVLAVAECGDMRADEMSIGVINGRTILLVANGDPGQPFISLFDVTNVVHPTGVFANDHCLPVVATTPYGPPLGNTTGTGLINPPTCILGQIYYDNASANNKTVIVDDGGLNGGVPLPAFPCPFPSNNALSGASGHAVPAAPKHAPQCSRHKGHPLPSRTPAQSRRNLLRGPIPHPFRGLYGSGFSGWNRWLRVQSYPQDFLCSEWECAAG